MSKSVFSFLSCCLLLLSVSAQCQTSKEFESVDQYILKGQYGAAMQELQALENTLSKDQHTIAWEIPLNRITSRFTEGNGYFFFLVQLSKYQSAKPEWDFALDEISVNNSRSDWEQILFCIEMATGDTVWARKVNGLVDYAVDKNTGGLFLFRDKLISVETETGEILSHYDLQKGVDGLLLSNEVFITKRRGEIQIEPKTELLIHSPTHNQDQTMNIGDFHFVSPSGKFKLIEADYGLQFAPTPSVIELSPYVMRGIGKNAPLWIEDVPFFMVQERGMADAISWVNPAYGHLMWKYQYAWGVYNHAWHSWGNGMRADQWFPFKPHGEYGLMTIDQGGYVRFLNYKDNTESAIKLANDYLGLPIDYKDQLIVPTYDWIRSYKESHIHHPDSSRWADIKVKQAEVLFYADKPDSALAVLKRVTDILPNRKDAWEWSAQIAEHQNLEQQFWLSYHNFMALDSNSENKSAYEKWGLLRRFDLSGKPVWKCAIKGDFVYAATNGGGFWAMRLSDLYFDKVSQLNRKMEYLKVEEDLEFFPGSVPDRKEIEFPLAAFPLKDVDPEWFKEGGPERISKAYVYRGKSFRTTIHGGVRELNDSTFTFYPPLLGEIGPWRLLFTNEEVFGYGDAVYKLDKHMRPCEVLIDILVDGVKPETVMIKAVKANDRSIAIVAYTSEGSFFRVYTHTGKLLHEVHLGKFPSHHMYEDQLVVLGNGYLFADRQIHWLSDSKNDEIWAYGPPKEYTRSRRINDRWRYFGNPVMHNGLVFLTAADGYLYVFDSFKITHPKEDKGFLIFD